MDAKAYNALNGTEKTDADINQEEALPSIEDVTALGEVSKDESNGRDYNLKSSEEWWESFEKKQKTMSKDKAINQEFKVLFSGEIVRKGKAKIGRFIKVILKVSIFLPVFLYFGVIYPYMISDNSTENMQGSIDYLKEKGSVIANEIKGVSDSATESISEEVDKITSTTDDHLNGETLVKDKDVKKFVNDFEQGKRKE